MKVLDEFATVSMALAGWSLARFGDGEIKMAGGAGYVREPGSPQLATELSSILRKPRIKCLPCIPTFSLDGPKGTNWQRHKRRFEQAVVPEFVYGSSLISRPDSAPWINCPAYYKDLSKLWAGKTVNVLAEPGNSILAVLELTARKLRHIECPHRESYAHIDEFEKALRAGKPNIIVMSCGPTATCLANRLSKYHQAIDIGSAGGFLLKLACAA